MQICPVLAGPVTFQNTNINLTLAFLQNKHLCYLHSIKETPPEAHHNCNSGGYRHENKEPWGIKSLSQGH